MIDTWATVGSCADREALPYLRRRRYRQRVGAVQAEPVIIEDDCFVGARAEVAEERPGRPWFRTVDGRLPWRVDPHCRPHDGEVRYGQVPPYSVVVSGTMPGEPLPDGSPGPSLYCAVIVKQVDEKTRARRRSMSYCGISAGLVDSLSAHCEPLSLLLLRQARVLHHRPHRAQPSADPLPERYRRPTPARWICSNLRYNSWDSPTATCSKGGDRSRQQPLRQMGK